MIKIISVVTSFRNVRNVPSIVLCDVSPKKRGMPIYDKSEHSSGFPLLEADVLF